MERITLFGKGGIGKSTIACGISASLAASGRRVLHVGCDPKHDSTAALLGGQMIEPVIDRITAVKGVRIEDIVVRSPLGIDCVEAGGPAAGVGCGGRGITRMLEIFDEAGLLAPDRYDLALYDVLGDVVCGGFAAPLRRGIGEKVVIVTSEELMSLYAANNIARAVVHYASNGIALAGLVVNLKDPDADRQVVERFAERISTKILCWVTRDPLIRQAEYERTTVTEMAPLAPIAKLFRELADQLLTLDVKGTPLPTPMEEEQFYLAARSRFRADVRAEPTPAAKPAVQATRVEPAPERSDVRPSSLARGPKVSADRQRKQAEVERYVHELRAGARAVRLGLVGADEALRRLQAAFPEQARTLRREELLA
ncbi:ArsA-related P-loop ATPase [Nannocystaceae bacterium ST9]